LYYIFTRVSITLPISFDATNVTHHKTKATSYSRLLLCSFILWWYYVLAYIVDGIRPNALIKFN